MFASLGATALIRSNSSRALARPSATMDDSKAATHANESDTLPPLTSSLSSPVPHYLCDFISGLTSGLVSRLAVAPLDLIKIRIQIQDKHAQANAALRYKSILDSVFRIVRDEGALAFWKGNFLGSFLVLPYGAVAFPAYRATKETINKHTKWDKQATSIISGGVSGLCGTFFSYPIDLLRTRFAAQRQRVVYGNIRHAVKDIYGKEGIRGFYAGCWPTLVGVFPLMALQFVSYEYFLGFLSARRSARHPGKEEHYIHTQDQMAAGFLAGVFSKGVTMPLDVVKKRFQVRSFDWRLAGRVCVGDYDYSSIRRLIKSIYEHEGIHGLYRGSIPALLKAGPNSAIIFLVYEQTMKWCAK